MTPLDSTPLSSLANTIPARRGATPATQLLEEGTTSNPPAPDAPPQAAPAVAPSALGTEVARCEPAAAAPQNAAPDTTREAGQPTHRTELRKLALPRPPALTASYPARLRQAFARRWPLALALGLAGGLAAFLLVQRLVPLKQTYAVEGWLEVGRPPAVLAGDSDPDAFRQAQLLALRSPAALRQVLQRPEFAGLARELPPDSALTWLESSVSVEAPASEPGLIRIQSHGDYPEPHAAVVRGMAEVWLQEMQKRQAECRRQLLAARRAVEAELQRKPAVAPAPVPVEEPAPPPAPVVDVSPRRVEIETALAALRTKRQKLETELAGVKDPEPMKDPGAREEELAQTLRSDHTFQDLLAALAKVEKDIKDTIRISVLKEKDPSLPPYFRRREDLVERLQRREKEVRQAIGAAEPQPDRTAEIAAQRKKLQEQIAEVREQEKQLRNELAALLTPKPVPPPVVKKPTPAPAPVDDGRAALEAKRQKLTAELETLGAEGQAPAWAKFRGESPVRVETNAAQRRTWGAEAGGCVFLFLALAVTVRECRIGRVRKTRDLAWGLEVPVLGALPPMPAREAATQAMLAEPREGSWQARVGESADVVRTYLLKKVSQGVVLVASAGDGEGKTTLAAQLAASLARRWCKTLLIDAHLKRPGAHQLFHVPQEPGLAELLRGEVERLDAVRPTFVSRLWLLPAGRRDQHAAQALAQDKTAALLHELRQQYDFVVIDGGSLLAGAETLLLAQHADTVVLAARADFSRLEEVHAAHERLAGLGAPLAGVVLLGGDDSGGTGANVEAAQRG
jgi:capsular exopolysaccharide synthesis family protein